MTESGGSLQSLPVQVCAAPAPEGPPPADVRQFRAWFDAHFDYVWHTLRRLGVRPADLEDVAHDVFLAVYRNLERFDPVRPVRPWLFGFAYRLASDYRRRAYHRLERLGQELEAADPHPGALELLGQREDRELVHAALETLELGRRAVFILHELDGHAIPEVAASLGIPLNTAYSRLRLARQQFASACLRMTRGAQ